MSAATVTQFYGLGRCPKCQCTATVLRDERPGLAEEKLTCEYCFYEEWHRPLGTYTVDRWRPV